MKASELRVGNLVKYDGDVFPIHSIEFARGNRIKHLNGNWIVQLFIDDHYLKVQMLSEINPIPLSGDWLINFGFEYKGSELIFNNEKYVISLMFYDFWFLFRVALEK